MGNRTEKKIENTRKKKKTAKRKINGRRVPLDSIISYFDQKRVDFIELHDALEELALVDPRKADVIRWRFFLGFKMQEVAKHMDISLSTVEKDWRLTRAWLRSQLEQE